MHTHVHTHKIVEEVSHWSGAQVLDWLRRKGLETFEHLVYDRIVPTGNHLLVLTEEYLCKALKPNENTELDIAALLAAVQQLKRENMRKSFGFS